MRVDSLISLAQSRKIKYSTDEAMALHTSFKLGGKADIFLCPETAEQMALLLKQAKQNPEEHADIMVKISGYSTRFTDLNEKIQDAVIERAQT